MQRGTRGFLLSRLLVDGPMDLGPHRLTVGYMSAPDGGHFYHDGPFSFYGCDPESEIPAVGTNSDGLMEIYPRHFRIGLKMPELDPVTYEPTGTWRTMTLVNDSFLNGLVIGPTNEQGGPLEGFEGGNLRMPVDVWECTGPFRIGYAAESMDGFKAGTLRWDDTTKKFECYDGAAWKTLAFEV